MEGESPTLTKLKKINNICFLYIASRALLQSRDEFSRLLRRNFLNFLIPARIIVP